MNCRYCSKEFLNNGSLAVHESLCKKNPDRKIYHCSYCGRELSFIPANIKVHEESCSKNPNRVNFNRNGFTNQAKSEGWPCDSCGLVFRTRRDLCSHYNENKDHRIHKTQEITTSLNKCQYCGKEWSTTKSGHSIHELYCKDNPNRLDPVSHSQTDESRAKISETAKFNKKSGGYRLGSGRGKHGFYKGYYCDSSWELAFVIYNLDHNIKFERNRKRFSYTFEGKTHNYIPDWIIDGSYIEIKGYWSKQWQAKLDQFPKNESLKVIDKNEIIPYIEYVESHYGKDFINLYENAD